MPPLVIIPYALRHEMMLRRQGILRSASVRNDPASAVHRYALQCARDDTAGPAGKRKTGIKAALLGVIAVWCACLAAQNAEAADEPAFEIVMHDGVITPQRLEVPAKTRFKIIIRNTGTIPAEFESTELRKEVVVPAGGTATMIIRTLDAGEYKFFDDFHVDAAPAVLVAK